MTTIQTPAVNSLTAEQQNLIGVLTQIEYEKYFQKGVNKAKSVEDVYKLRNQVNDAMNNEFARLGKAYIQKDEEQINDCLRFLAKNTAMQIGFELGLRA